MCTVAFSQSTNSPFIHTLSTGVIGITSPFFRRRSVDRQNDQTSLAQISASDYVFEYVFWYLRVHRKPHQRLAALGPARHLHVCDVDPFLTEQSADDSDDAGTVYVLEEGHDRRERHVEVVSENPNEPLVVPLPHQDSPDRNGVTVTLSADLDEVHVVERLRGLRLLDRNPSLGCKQGCVDERNGLVHNRGECSFEPVQGKSARVVFRDASVVFEFES